MTQIPVQGTPASVPVKKTLLALLDASHLPVKDASDVYLFKNPVKGIFLRICPLLYMLFTIALIIVLFEPTWVSYLTAQLLEFANGVLELGYLAIIALLFFSMRIIRMNTPWTRTPVENYDYEQFDRDSFNAVDRVMRMKCGEQRPSLMVEHRNGRALLVISLGDEEYYLYGW